MEVVLGREQMGIAFGVWLTVALVAAVLVPQRLARREGRDATRLLPFQLGLAVVALAGAKLFSVFERGGWNGSAAEFVTGFRYPGALLAALPAYPLLRRFLPTSISVPMAFDLIAPGLGIGAAIMRLHCWAAGCCTGVLCRRAWCVTYPRYSPPFEHQVAGGLITHEAAASLPVHPLELYFLLASLTAVVVTLRLRKWARRPGETLLVFLVAHEGAKAVLESLRFPAAPVVRTVSAGLAVTSVVLLIVSRWSMASPTRTHVDALR